MMNSEDMALLNEYIEVEEHAIDAEKAAQVHANLQDAIQTVDLSVEQFSLLQKISSGRSMTTSSGLVNLRFAHFGGSGLQLQATLEQQPLTLWMDEQQ